MKQNRTRGRLAGALAISVLALTAACSAPPTVGAGSQGGSASGAFADFDAMPEGERMDALVDAAEEEGKVVVHLRADEVGPEIEKTFEDKYDIDLVILNPGNTQTVQQQLFEEARAGRTEADVVEVQKHEVENNFVTEDIVAPMPKFLAESARDPKLVSEFAIETHSYPFAVWWNTNQVSGSAIPRSLEDLNDPRWDGRIIMLTNTFPWYMTAFQILVEDEGMPIEEFETLMKGIAEKADTTNSTSPAAQAIASGQYWATPSGAVSTFQRVKDAPYEFEPAVAPVPIVPAGIGLMKDAPHPAAAMLFSHWYITEGLDISEKEFLIEYHENETDLKDVAVRRLDAEELTSERINEWRTVYNNLLSGREPVTPEYVRGD
jgi:iron(III) transport system substrate-binding protein